MVRNFKSRPCAEALRVHSVCAQPLTASASARAVCWLRLPYLLSVGRSFRSRIVSSHAPCAQHFVLSNAASIGQRPVRASSRSCHNCMAGMSPVSGRCSLTNKKKDATFLDMSAFVWHTPTSRMLLAHDGLRVLISFPLRGFCVANAP